MRIVLTLLIFLADIVASRYLGVALKGDYFFLASSVLLVGTLLTGGMHLGNVYYLRSIPLSQLSANTLIYVSGVALIVFCAGFPLASKIPVLARGNQALTVIFIFCLVLDCTCTIFMNFFIGLGELARYAMVRIVRRGMFLVLLLGAWLIWEPSLELTLFFYLATTVIALALTGYLLPLQSGVFRCQWQSLGRCLSYGLRSQALVSVDMGTQRINTIVLGFWATSMDNGLFSVALNFGQALWLLSGVLYVVVQAGVSHSAEKQLADLERLCRHSLFLMVIGGFALGLLADPLVRLVYGAEFEGSGALLRLMLPGFAGYSLYTLCSSFMIVNGRAGTALLGSLGGLLVNVTIGLALIPHMAATGAAMALSWGYLSGTMLLMFLICVIFKARPSSLLFLRRADLQHLASVLSGWRKCIGRVP